MVFCILQMQQTGGVNLGHGGSLGQPNLGQNNLGPGMMGNMGMNQPVIYTVGDNGQLVPLQVGSVFMYDFLFYLLRLMSSSEIHAGCLLYNHLELSSISCI